MALGLYILLIVVVGILWKVFKFYFKSSINPFKYDTRTTIRPKVIDQKERDAVLKQSFKTNKVPDGLDAIVIGSGIGGLSVAALLSKAGKKVLVLEQHDQAGGCCHTFIEKGYEFDVGIHYLGELHYSTPAKTYLDQISDGQIQFEPLDDTFETIVFAGKDPAASRYFPLYSDLERQKENLKKLFPGEERAIDRFYELSKEAVNAFTQACNIKFLPFWLAKMLIRLKVVHKMFSFFKLNEKTLKEVVSELTSNETLRDIFCYCCGDYGATPSQAGFPMHALIVEHFTHGAAYPVAGASEFAFNIIPVIERSGGKVLVRAEVTEILLNSVNVAEGVKVRHGTHDTKVFAPIVISNAGLYNTLLKFLPRDVSRESRLFPFVNKKRSVAALSVFVGFDATPEDLGIPGKTNYFLYADNDIDKICLDYINTPKEEYEDKKIAFTFLSFPSTKDPTWEKRYPGKTTMTLLSMCNYEWFQEWEKEPCKRRGDEYERLKKTMAWKMIDRVIEMFPKIKDRIDYVNVGTPLSNNFYLGTMKGEIYGLDHDQDRFRPLNYATLRPATDIPGLYLSGQDVSCCGFVGALYGGLLCAQQILGRNLINDLERLHNKIGIAQKIKEE